MGEKNIENSVIIIQKWVRGWLVRKEHIEFFKKIKIRKLVINEIIGFEKTYISKINHLLDNLKTPLLNSTSIPHDKIHNLFSNFDEIKDLHITIHNKLVESKPLIITQIYLEMLPKFSIYYPYVKNYNNAYKIYSILSEEDEEFVQLADQFGYLPSFLILPIQQTPRYLLLFNELLKNTNVQNIDYPNMQKLIETVRETAKRINDCITSNENDNDEEDNSSFSKNNSNNIDNKKSNNGANIKRPASASSKRKPRNSIAMHKKAIDAVLSEENNSNSHSSNNNDYSHLPSYLRPTLASSAWSRSKVEYSPSPKFRFSHSFQENEKYVYDNPLPTGIHPPSELFTERYSTPKKQQQQQQSNSSTSSSLPPWKPPSKSTTSIVDNCTKITKKTVFTRPPSPPPKPNFYIPYNSNSNSNSSINNNNNSNNSSSNSSSLNNSSSSSSSGSNSGSSTPLKATNLPLQSITNNEISLTSTPSSLKPPLSPSRHSSSSDKVIIEKLSISGSDHTKQTITTTTTTTITTTTTSSSSSSSSAFKPQDKVKKSLSSNNLFNSISSSISNGSSVGVCSSNGSSGGRTISPINVPSSANSSSRTSSPVNTGLSLHHHNNNHNSGSSNSNNNNSNTNNDNKSSEKTSPLSVVVSQ